MDYDQIPVWRGNFQNGLPHGSGQMSNNTTGTITGSFVNGQPHGYCKQSIMHPIDWLGIYNGYMQDGERSGFGTVLRGNRYEYSGFWRKNKPDGIGILTDKGGEIWSFMSEPTQKFGRFKDGELIQIINREIVICAIAKAHEILELVKSSQKESDWNSIEVEAEKIIDARNQAAMLRIQRFWRDVTSNPMYKLARKKIRAEVENEASAED
tara:strand:- start:6 stop:635 length:630 start_codon:yes stop_codon:yes gene_type:complete